MKGLVMIGMMACLTLPLRGQGTQPLPGSRITNAGVVRAGAKFDSVFVDRTRTRATVDIGDLAAHLFARLGVPPFDDSLAFRVSSDTSRIKIAGRLMDFPPEARAELGPIFSFLDSTTVFTVEISLPQREGGLMRFRLERVTVRGFPIPEIILLPALAEYRRRYPVLSASGTEFLVAMPTEAHVILRPNALELRMPPKQ